MNSRTTEFSPCRKYRYTLWREWSVGDTLLFAEPPKEKIVTPPGDFKYLMVIGLNPSTADETKDDPTIRRCIDFAKRWGFGALCMTNLFAWRDTKPANMRKAAEPIGAENDRYLLECARGAGLILAAWGKNGSFMRRDTAVLSLLPSVHRLRLNDDGSPEHPLYIPATTLPVPFTTSK